MTRLSARRRFVLPLVASFAIAGCGTTVPSGGASVASGARTSGGLAGTAGGATSGSPAGAPPSSSTGQGNQLPTASSTLPANAPAPGSAAGSTATTTSGQVVSGGSPRQATGGTIKIGIQTFSGYQQAGQAVGAGGAGLAAQSAETQQNAQLVVDYLNAHGGIAGRQIVPVYQDTNIYSAQSFDEDAQATCAAFTQDNRVFAVITPEIFDWDTLITCLAQHKTPLIASSVNIYDQAFANQFPDLFYEPSMVFGNRWSVLIDSLVSQGFFGSGSVIGIIRSTWPGEADTAALLKSTLGRYGLTVKDEVAVQDEQSTSDVGSTLSDMSSVELRFRSEGINRVLFTQGPVFPLGFMTAAQSQAYYPSYGLTSEANLAFLESDAPAGQVRNLAGITFDGLPGAPLTNSATALCARIGPSATLNPYCGKLLLLADALSPSSSLTPAGLDAALSKVQNFVSPDTFATGFVKNPDNGPSAERPFAWSASCSCLAYTGGLRSIP